MKDLKSRWRFQVNAAFNAADQVCWTSTGTGTGAAPPVGATMYTHDANGNQTKPLPLRTCLPGQLHRPERSRRLHQFSGLTAGLGLVAAGFTVGAFVAAGTIFGAHRAGKALCSAEPKHRP